MDVVHGRSGTRVHHAQPCGGEAIRPVEYRYRPAVAERHNGDFPGGVRGTHLRSTLAMALFQTALDRPARGPPLDAFLARPGPGATGDSVATAPFRSAGLDRSRIDRRKSGVDQAEADRRTKWIAHPPVDGLRVRLDRRRPGLRIRTRRQSRIRQFRRFGLVGFLDHGDARLWQWPPDGS